MYYHYSFLSEKIKIHIIIKNQISKIFTIKYTLLKNALATFELTCIQKQVIVFNIMRSQYIFSILVNEGLYRK